MLREKNKFLMSILICRYVFWSGLYTFENDVEKYCPEENI